jgi:hypothetical protein
VSIPVEFGGAAYRYGHSQIRERYRVNDDSEAPFFPGPLRDSEGPPDLEDLPFDPEDLPIDAEDFPFDPGEEELTEMPDDVGGDESLAGFGAVPESLVVDWRYFFAHDEDTDPADPGTTVQPAAKIDAALPPSLFALPPVEEGVDSLAARNLLRGRALRLPAGQAVADDLGLESLSNADLPVDGQSYADVLHEYGRGADPDAPLWLYVLCEADAQQDGERLGAVGSRIVAEVLTGLARAAASTYLDAEGWRPRLPRPITADEDPTDTPSPGLPYRIADLLAFATGPSPDGLALTVDADGTGEAPTVENSTDGEAVVLDHHGDGDRHLSGYRVDFDDGQRREFGDDGVSAPTLSPDERVVVYTGDATPPEDETAARTLALGYERAVIANDGSDTVTLVTDLGVVSDWAT